MMEKALHKYLQGMEERIVARVSVRVFESQEQLARITKRGFDETTSQFGEIRSLLFAIAEAIDADVPSLHEGVNFSETLSSHRKDIDALARRVKTLEEKGEKRR